MTNPRGTTVSIRYSSDESRPKRWGVHWNEYTEGFRGRPKQRAKFYATQAEAEQVKAIVEAELAQPLPITAPKPVHRAADSFAALAGFDYAYDRAADRKGAGPQYTGWLKWVQQEREVATLNNYRDAIRNYLAPPKGHQRYPGLGHLIISDTTVEWLVFKRYLQELHEREGTSLSMRKRLFLTLSAFCAWAKDEGRLKIDNPCHGMGKKLRRKGEVLRQRPPNPFTPDEITRIFDQLRAVEDLPIVAYYTFQYHCGTRPGEATALKWEHVDLSRQRATIEASYSSDSKEDKDPKTHKAREIELTDEVVELLLRWRPLQRQEAFRRGLPQPVYVFTTRHIAHHTRELGRIKQNANIRTILGRTLRACGITGHKLYDFRHSFATGHLVHNWDKLTWVANQLGNDPQTTREYYYAFRSTAQTRGFINEIGGFGK